MLDKKVFLGNMCVADIRYLLVEDPAVLRPDDTEEELLAKMVEDPRTRHVYVVDEAGVLIGVVRMNSVVERLFPFSAVLERGTEFTIRGLANFGSGTVAEIMDDQPRFVYESTSLSDVAKILMQEQINELPVLDEKRRVIGQVNVYEIINAYLNEVQEHGDSTAR